MITTVLIIDILGTVVGLWAIYKVMSLGVGGKVKSALVLVNWGIAWQVVAFVYTIIFSRLKLFPIPGGINIHHFLMLIGMIFFVFAAIKLTSFIQVTEQQ